MTKTMTTLDASRRKLYLEGRTTVFAYDGDPRFSYCLYVPPAQPAAPPPGLVVAVHHSMRNFMQCRDAFAELGERRRQVVLAPLFPVGVEGDGNPDGYKYLIESSIRYDLVLNGMIDLVAGTTGCNADRFCIFGFSGGGHFVNRYLLTHPERLLAASMGAPGQVTLLDDRNDWWVGLRDVETLFGRPFNLDAARRVAVQMIVGSEDTETWEITHAPGSRYYRAEAADSGGNRIERLRSLQRSFEAAGLPVQFDLMPGVKHVSTPAMVLAQAFFDRHLAPPAA